GSIASAGAETVRYGGNTACVQVTGEDGTVLILDAGTGLRRLGVGIDADQRPLSILLSHLHLDHIQGLGFFRPFFRAESEIHIWGPPSTTADLRTRLNRYLSPPLFPVRLKDLPSRVELHDVAREPWRIGELEVLAESVIHPDAAVGYRITDGGSTFAYLPDHEPALGGSSDPRWISGFRLAADVDLLFHDAQYTDGEYTARLGWGHSSMRQAVSFANRVGAKRLALFHHDPDHDDDHLDRLVAEAQAASTVTEVGGAREGEVYEV
ncbi:MAG: MBL fold metallo-hydrolase, partial [Candidatus Limnocylindria bacterium]